MDLESESVEDNEVNPQTVFHADDKDNDDGSNEIRNNVSCANVTENVANTRVNHVDTAQPVNLTLLAANSPGGGSPPTVKGHGLKKWKRIKRNFPRDDSDNAVDDSSKVLKRGLSGNGNPVKSKNSPREINHNSEGSVGSVNMLRNVGVVDGFAIHGSSSDSRFAVGSAFAAGADSENSEDRSSKSSTAASVPKAKYELPAVLGHAREKNRMKSTGGKGLNSSAQRAQQGRVQIESSKKHRGDRVKVEKENSYSSVESDSRSSSYVFMQSPILTSNGKHSGRSMSHDGENSDEVHASEQHYSEEVQTGYSKENVGEAEFFSQDDFLADLPWKVKGEKNKNRRSLKDQDPLFESILNLQSVQEALAKGSVKWGPISKEQEDEVERVRSSLSETERERKNLVTQENLYESGLLQGMAGIIKGSTKVAMDLDDPEMQKRLRKSRVKKVKKGGAQQAVGKRPRDDEGRVVDVVGKKRALEEAHRSVMGTGPRLPPLDFQAPLKLPFGMDDVYAEGVEKMDFSKLRRQKKEVNLAMHRQEVPLVNVFLEGVKSDLEVLVKTPAITYAARAQKTFLIQAYGYGEMYVNMAKADKEIQRLKRRNETIKDKIAEAHDAIKEKNNLVLQKAVMTKEMEEMKRSMAKEMEEMKRSRAEEVAAARVEAIESFRGSEELRSYIMDQIVAMQMRWEDRVARFNPSVMINFDTSGEPPSPSPSTDDTAVAPESEPATGDAPSTES